MPTQVEETQTKEFLERAQIRTMKKDLLALREADSLQEKDKIANIKTFEEQQAEQEKRLQTEALADKFSRQEVLQKNEKQEALAQTNLKNYATEQERQQIFLLESQRLAFEKQVDEIDKRKDSALKLEKNKLQLQSRDLQTKLNAILEQEKKIDDEQKLVLEKARITSIASERKALELRRDDLDKKIQDIEKSRWETERQIEVTNNQSSLTDNSLKQSVVEKNQLQDKLLSIDKSLREIYSVIMTREQAKRNKESNTTESLIRAEKNKIEQNQQIYQNVPVPIKKRQPLIPPIPHKN